MAEPAIDWEALTHALARTLERPTDTHTYQGAPYASKDPGTYRYRSGEVEPDVGLLDPVDILAGILAPYLVPGLKAAGSAALRSTRLPRTQPPAEGYTAQQVDDILKQMDAWAAQEEASARIGSSMDRIIESLQRTQQRGEPLSAMRVPESGPSFRIPARQPMRETVEDPAGDLLAQWLQVHKERESMPAYDVWQMLTHIQRLLDEGRH